MRKKADFLDRFFIRKVLSVFQKECPERSEKRTGFFIVRILKESGMGKRNFLQEECWENIPENRNNEVWFPSGTGRTVEKACFLFCFFDFIVTDGS